MIRALFFHAILRASESLIGRVEKIRSWAWNRIVSGWPPEVAADILRRGMTWNRNTH